MIIGLYMFSVYVVPTNGVMNVQEGLEKIKFSVHKNVLKAIDRSVSVSGFNGTPAALSL